MTSLDRIERLHAALVEAMEARGHSADEPIKVSRIFRDLVPYRSVRTRLGIDLNADYEHALLGLLAGIGGRVRVEPASARDELRSELEAPFPDVGLFRKFAACDAWVSLPPAEPALEDPAGQIGEPAGDPRSAVGDAVETGDGAEHAGSEDDVVEQDTVEHDSVEHQAGAHEAGAHGVFEQESLEDDDEVVAAAVPDAEDEPGRATRRAVDPPACVFCSQPLPPVVGLRFCPYCGGDQRLRPCPRCEAILESDWRYCISCGEAVG